jgi:hypothetical protein
MVKSKRDLRDIKANALLVETPLMLHVVEEFAASQKVHHKVNSILPLKNKLHLHDERVVNLKHDHHF